MAALSGHPLEAVWSTLAQGGEVRDVTLAGSDLADFLVAVVRGERLLPRGLKLRGCRIEGDLDLEALVLDFPVYLNGCTFTGPVTLRHARMKGLFLEGAAFHQVVDARDMTVAGQIVLRQAWFARPMLLRDCHVEGQLNLLGARFAGIVDRPRNWMEEHAWGQTLSLARSRLGSLKWQDVTIDRAALIDFTDLQVGSLLSGFTDADFDRCWPEPGRLMIEGIRIGRLDRGPAERLLRWARLAPDFAPAALRSIASALASAGLAHSEEVVMAAVKRGEVARLASRPRRLFYRLVFGVSGYGLHATRVLVLSTLSFIAALLVALLAQGRGYIAPVFGALIDKACYYTGPACGEAAVGWRPIVIQPGQVRRYVPRDYPAFSPFRFTAERVLPIIEARQRDTWDMALAWVSYLHRLLAAIALFLAGVFLGTVSGLLRPGR